MSSASRAWVVATSVGVVEALKEQGLCRWNHALRSAHRQLRNHAPSLSQDTKLSSSSSSALASTRLKHGNADQPEHSLRTIMYLSCWAPS